MAFDQLPDPLTHPVDDARPSISAACPMPRDLHAANAPVQIGCDADYPTMSVVPSVATDSIIAESVHHNQIPRTLDQDCRLPASTAYLVTLGTGDSTEERSLDQCRSPDQLGEGLKPADETSTTNLSAIDDVNSSGQATAGANNAGLINVGAGKEPRCLNPGSYSREQHAELGTDLGDVEQESYENNRKSVGPESGRLKANTDTDFNLVSLLASWDWDRILSRTDLRF